MSNPLNGLKKTLLVGVSGAPSVGPKTDEPSIRGSR